MAETGIKIICPNCRGTGSVPCGSETPHSCKHCGGTGYDDWGQITMDLDDKFSDLSDKVDDCLDKLKDILERLHE